jgi:hypothetical protein
MEILWPFELCYSAIWYILWPFGNLVAIWYNFPRFGILCHVKSGNPGPNSYLHSYHMSGLAADRVN